MRDTLLMVSCLCLLAASATAQVDEPAPGELEPAVSFEPENTGSAAGDDGGSLKPEASSAGAEADAAEISGSEPEAAFDTMDHLQLDATSVTGNRELPKVLYIVPWKKSDLGDLRGRPVNSLVDEVLSPVDRDVFRRHLQYYSDIKEPGGQASPGE